MLVFFAKGNWQKACSFIVGEIDYRCTLNSVSDQKNDPTQTQQPLAFLLRKQVSTIERKEKAVKEPEPASV